MSNEYEIGQRVTSITGDLYKIVNHWTVETGNPENPVINMYGLKHVFHRDSTVCLPERSLREGFTPEFDSPAPTEPEYEQLAHKMFAWAHLR